MHNKLNQLKLVYLTLSLSKAGDKMKTKKFLLTILTSGLLAFLTSQPAFADPSRGATNSVPPSQDIQAKLDEAESIIEQYDSQIEDLIYELEDIHTEMNIIQKDILSAEEELKSIESSINESKDIADARVKAMYINGVDGYLNVLLDSQSFSDFISKVDTLKTIIEFDTKIIEELNLKRDEISSKRALLENRRDTLQQLEAQNTEKLTRLNKLKEDQEKLIKSLTSDTKKKSNADSFKFIPGSSFGDSVVSFALQFRGVPYVWGGSTPSGFDCSGFTRYVFGNFGINLERRSSSQAKQGVPVAYNDLRPGDLVFFGSTIHHVGIYVGNDMFIHAPRTGDVVKISPMRYMDFNCARRISN